MSTRSLVGYTEGNKIKYIYVHWDGYPSHRMPMLSAFDTLDKVKGLIDLGDLSTLGCNLQSCEKMRGEMSDDEVGISSEYREFTDDRVDTPHHFIPLEILADLSEESWCEYCYLFHNGTWYYSRVRVRV